ncbi:efflux transporter outer membrane subunit [Pseudenhygromyxa sp. WMMC2535]|uniref:efflux transporter outer membrane subunit n=1 Tax=Pseudenhygromyxa sp. WMMC2535 TaxID=2712867 RepID=UPI00155477F1|nr:efflux transporter outer membrane subunit [Pseudenhygromyxa sp. WMMC2535]NVB40996.1 efflux transporter outer membrane subunit [Pseudenhygromyxa sp. WMMC2535]
MLRLRHVPQRAAALAPLLISTALSGCLAPVYERPEAPVSDGFPSLERREGEDPSSLPTAAAEGEALPDWRAVFTDPTLQELIDRALENNRQLRSTALSVEQARVQLRLARSAFGPSFTLEASYSNTHVPASTSPFGESYTVNRFDIGPAVSWQLDLFGRIRYQRNAAIEQTVAAAEDWRAARIALIADVAGTALQERVYAERRKLAQEALDARIEAAEIVSAKVDAGLSTELELRQVEALVVTAEVSLAQLERATAQTHNALVMLVGEPVEPLAPSGPDLEAMVMSTVPAGMPSDLLNNRPDIRAAEHRLIATHADIGAARAAFFPQISLSGSMSTASSALLGLFQPGTLAWSFVAPNIVQPLFNWGGKRADLQAAKISQEAAVASYEAAIQSAFREVADVLVSWPTVEDELVSQEALLEVQSARVSLANQRFDAGVSDYLEVLDAERERFAAEQSLMDVRLSKALLAVSLFEVVGGGVESTAPMPDGEELPESKPRR